MVGLEMWTFDLVTVLAAHIGSTALAAHQIVLSYTMWVIHDYCCYYLLHFLLSLMRYLLVLFLSYNMIPVHEYFRHRFMILF